MHLGGHNPVEALYFRYRPRTLHGDIEFFLSARMTWQSVVANSRLPICLWLQSNVCLGSTGFPGGQWRDPAASEISVGQVRSMVCPRCRVDMACHACACQCPHCGASAKDLGGYFAMGAPLCRYGGMHACQLLRACGSQRLCSSVEGLAWIAWDSLYAAQLDLSEYTH